MTLSWAGNISTQIDKLNQKIPYASKSETKEILHQLENYYISAVVSENKAYISKALRGIIRCKKLLHINPSTYEKELQSLGIKPKIHTTKPVAKKKKVIPKKSQPKKVLSIRSIKKEKNTLIIRFDRTVHKEDIFFFKINVKNSFKNIYDVKANLNFKTPKLSFPHLKQLKIAQNKDNKVRIVLFDEQKIYSKAHIKKDTLYIKITAYQKQKTSIKKTFEKVHPKKLHTPIMIPSKKSPKNDQTIYASSKTIVIDAGHGGHDSGAVGYKKYQEKRTVYKVSKLLKSLLESKGYKVHMTRSADKFIKLKNRTHLANKKDADLFISIHANAAPKGKFLSLKGIETFFLSPAKTAKAKRIAAKENSAASGMNKKSQDTLLSFLNRNKIIQSNKLAIDVQSGMLTSTRKKFKGVKDGGVREAPFWVLVGAQMPAVLVELGYITNPTEGERLFNPFYQKALAKGIYNGINSYFAHNK